MKLTPISAPRQIHGEGFPERKVTAPVGSIYIDTLATAGAVRWVKTTGTGNTGWAVEYGDTGWRAMVKWDANEVTYGELPSGLIPQEYDGGVFFRRVNGNVTMRIMAAISETTSFSLPIPTGFSAEGSPYPLVTIPIQVPQTHTRITPHGRAGLGRIYVYTPETSQSSPVYLPAAGGSYASETTWGTSRAWPSVLDGTPS